MADVQSVLVVLGPFIPWIVVLFLVLVFYFEAKGAYHRWGTTSHRSSGGKAFVLLLVGVAATVLIYTGWLLYGALLFVAVFLGVTWWALAWNARRGAPVS